jgi:hypothetical protein
MLYANGGDDMRQYFRQRKVWSVTTRFKLMILFPELQACLKRSCVAYGSEKNGSNYRRPPNIAKPRTYTNQLSYQGPKLQHYLSQIPDTTTKVCTIFQSHWVLTEIDIRGRDSHNKIGKLARGNILLLYASMKVHAWTFFWAKVADVGRKGSFVMKNMIILFSRACL